MWFLRGLRRPLFRCRIVGAADHLINARTLFQAFHALPGAGAEPCQCAGQHRLDHGHGGQLVEPIGGGRFVQLARQLATLDQMLQGRLTINIISSDLPGAPIDGGPRYARSREVMTILRTLLRGEPLDHHGEFYDLVLDPPRVASDAAQARGGTAPPFYFGGMSDPARDTAAEHADVFLMWPDTMDGVQSTISDMRARADAHGRSLRFGYRVHVVVRETEDAARAAAFDLVSRLEPEVGAAVRQRSLDASSVGVARQTDLRDRADADGYVEANLWTGIGRARSGCGAAIVGDPDQVVAKLREYEALGIDSFILSGYPHREECELVGRHVVPAIRGRTT